MIFDGLGANFILYNFSFSPCFKQNTLLKMLNILLSSTCTVSNYFNVVLYVNVFFIIGSIEKEFDCEHTFFQSHKMFDLV